MDEKTTFCKRLKEWRDKAGLSQEEAALRLGVTRSYLSEVENGRPPGRKLVNSLAAAEKADFDLSTNEGCRRALEWLIQTMPLAVLVERLNTILSDDSKPLAERLQVANLINPVIEQRKAKSESQISESRKPENQG